MTTEGSAGQHQFVQDISLEDDRTQAVAVTDGSSNNVIDGSSTDNRMEPSPTSGLSLLIEWANNQENWIRKIVNIVVQTRSHLLEEHIAEIHELFLREKKLIPGAPPNIKLLSSSPLSAPSSKVMKLTSLKHKESVNALTPGQEIQFHSRLTICFGENATGKTGYVRILKQAAGVRTAQPVLPNVHRNGSEGPPRASIKVIYDDKERTIDWRGEPAIEPLTRLIIFDARAALVHVNEDLTYSYTPADLSLFPLVTDGIERVQERLQTVSQNRKPHSDPTDNRFPRESKVYELTRDLGSSTNLHEIKALAEISDEEGASISILREKVTALSSGAIRQQIVAISQEREALSQVLSIGETIADFDREAYTQAITALRTARANHQQATREALAGEAIPGILGNAWQEFVEAAEGYISDVGLDPYPESGAACIYCRQPLDKAAVELIQKYRDYCNAVLRLEVEQAEDNLRKLCGTVNNLSLDENEREIDRLVESSEDPTNPQPAQAAAREVLRHARVLCHVIAEEGSCPPTTEGLLRLLDTIRTGAETAKIARDDLCKQGEEREQVLKEERRRLLDLEARVTLRDIFPAIQEYVQAAEWVDRCQSYLQEFPSIKRSLTDTAKRASNEVMNRHFKELFQKECELLRAPSITLEFPGREGKARRRKSMTPDHGIGEILSEGEQKVLALADFLAEATLNPDCSPIVLDDPVTSLDHKRLRYVADRLVELSRNRQVVVFTHDIWFAAELMMRFESEPKECKFYDVTNEDQRIGVIERGSHPRTDTFKSRKRHLTTLIEQAAKETGEKREATVEKGYEQLRGACEIVVEKDLLKGVTERYRPNVRMTVLPQIRADRLPAAIDEVTQIFEKCCGIISSHSQPLVTRGVRPSLDDLKEDWKALMGARQEYLQ